MTHRLNALLLVLVALIGAPFYWLLLHNPSRDVPPHPVTIAELRALGDSRPGARPTGVEMTIVGWRLLSGNLFAAGAGLKRKGFTVISFRLLVPGGSPIVIDTGTSAALAGQLQLDRFMPGRQAVVDGNMRSAGLILATGEQPEHLGGLAAFAAQPDSAVALTRARLNPHQVPAHTADDHLPWPSGLVLRPGIAGQRAQAVAPGVVVIPAPGAAPGSQMIYVHLQNGREYLFTGDIAPFAVNFLELRTRSNLLSRFWAQQDRAAVMRWLVTIDALRRHAPGLIVVPGHDAPWISDPRNRTGIVATNAPAPLAKPAGT